MVKKNGETVLAAIKETGSETNAEKTRYISTHQNAGKKQYREFAGT
jgi:hypothetical protein